MRLKTLALMLSLIMLIGIMTGCTPKPQDSAETYTVPEIASDTAKLPDGETVVEPLETGEQDNAPAPVESGSENLPADEDSDLEDSDDGGLVIESEYTFEIGDDLGVGGN